MKSYSETDVFSPMEQNMFTNATRLVAKIPSNIEHKGQKIELRCHELTRVVGHILGLEPCDGWLGMISHSWLWTIRPRTIDGFFLNEVPNILDVYTPGRLPQVQLVASSTALPWEYRRGPACPDLDHDLIETLVNELKRRPELGLHAIK